jgi:hypothetical protein
MIDCGFGLGFILWHRAQTPREDWLPGQSPFDLGSYGCVLDVYEETANASLLWSINPTVPEPGFHKKLRGSVGAPG